MGRSDLTKLPLSSTSKLSAYEATQIHLTNVPLPISEKCLYVLQEFLTGNEQSEYCTHASVLNGQLRSFLACPSNDLLMRYISCNDTVRAGVDKLQAKEFKIIGEKTEEWTKLFLSKWSKKLEEAEGRSVSELTGHFSL